MFNIILKFNINVERYLETGRSSSKMGPRRIREVGQKKANG